MGLVFNETTPIENLPDNDAVINTLVKAINSTTFNVSFVPNSFNVTRTPLQTIATTNTTTAAPTTTTAAPTTTTATTVEATVTKRLTFRSAGETFTNDLLDSSSAAFQNRAGLLKSNLEPLYQREFSSSFRDFTVRSFSNGSIINNIDLKFALATAPNNTQISEVLVNAASTITAFNIDTSSITVDGTQTSSGISHNISLITAFSMILLSWLLSSQ
ncbi:uncharacterized protein LOC119782516 [Cyprinodon tularosa]|uniref:uncharacterized protein LOC119782516 n=1 Tax=Cyprinodon tularosa TaxID=77115 RepID=UPI0018E26FE6|nr:uncharacterized protein LOC119782516 [Cyprinodon tularosa]